jgi:LmbE family N-acetylglucosaminyl deacetylase
MKTLVVAPHPDDETLGVGGTLLRRKSEGAQTAWLIMTQIDPLEKAKLEIRRDEISKISKIFGFDKTYELGFPTTKLDQIPMSELVNRISKVVNEFQPSEIFLPHPSDIHTDHKVTFQAVSSCIKWFRSPSVTRILAYETLSETEFGLTKENFFRPNYFVDIEKFLDKKIHAMNTYESEVHSFPFPRSVESIRSLSLLRGSSSGFNAAEAFELLNERI